MTEPDITFHHASAPVMMMEESYPQSAQYSPPPSAPSLFIPPGAATASMTIPPPVLSMNNNNMMRMNPSFSLIRLHPTHADYKNTSFDGETMRTLHQQGYTDGFIQSLHQTIYAYPLRIWIVDNSGSMKASDGTKIVTTDTTNLNHNNTNQQQPTMKMITGCSRWIEMQQTIEYHAQFAAHIRAPMVFCFLNPPTTSSPILVQQEFGIGIDSYDTIPNDVRIALQNTSNHPIRCHAVNISFEWNTSSYSTHGTILTSEWYKNCHYYCHRWLTIGCTRVYNRIYKK
jgi:hypothetical protein